MSLNTTGSPEAAARKQVENEGRGPRWEVTPDECHHFSISNAANAATPSGAKSQQVRTPPRRIQSRSSSCALSVLSLLSHMHSQPPPLHTCWAPGHPKWQKAACYAEA